MTDDFDKFERRCVMGMFGLLAVIVAGGGWWLMSGRTPDSASANMPAGNAATLQTAGPAATIADHLASSTPPTLITPLPQAAPAPVVSAQQITPPPPTILPTAATASDTNTAPVVKVVVVAAAAPADSGSANKFTLNYDAAVAHTLIVAAPVQTPSPATQPTSVKATIAPPVAAETHDAPKTPAATVASAEPSSPLLLRTLPLRVIHVLASETDSSEWYELKLNPSQASSLHDTLLALGNTAGADCDESDHLTPNTLPPALGVQWWLPGELSDLDLISLKTSGATARHIVLALSARTGRAYLYASDAITFPNE